MPASIRSAQIAAISPTAQAPRSPPGTRPLDRSVHPIALPPRQDVAYFTNQARALAGPDAAQNDVSKPVPVTAPGVTFDAYA